jgi:hypothetical protein
LTTKEKQNLSVLIADRLVTIATPECVALAARLLHCAGNSNLFVGVDMQDAANPTRKFVGRGSLGTCNSRFCPFCNAKPSRRNRKIAEYIVRNQPKLPNHFWRFIVLTMPDDCLRHLSYLQQREIFYEAWVLFSQKNQWFDDTFTEGVIKTEESTYKIARAVAGNGYHNHGNLIAYSEKPHHLELKKNWTLCLKAVFKRFGITWVCPTKNGYANVYIKLIVAGKVSKNSKTHISEVDAIRYVCKYICKPSDWLDVPLSDLQELAEKSRFPRQFEVVGKFKKIAQQMEKPKFVPPVPFLINYRQHGTIWMLNTGGYIYDKSISLNFDHCKSCCDCHNSPVVASRTPSSWLSYSEQSLNLKNTVPRMSCSCNSPPPPPPPPPPPRRKSWFLRIKNREISVAAYKIELIQQFKDARDYRIKQLRENHPTAKFRLLNGFEFHGVDCSCGRCPII